MSPCSHRQWSPLALWQFREYNELPHIFEQRINRSISPANRYIALFHNTYLEIVARCVAYICGAFVATLLLVSVLSEDSLLYIHIGEHNLLWYLGIFSATYAVFRSFIPDDSKAREAPDDLMKEICIHTHIFPEKWVQRPSSPEVKEELCYLFQYKVQIFLMEMLSVLLTPLVLCYSLPSSAEAVLEFIRSGRHTIEDDNNNNYCILRTYYCIVRIHEMLKEWAQYVSSGKLTIQPCYVQIVSLLPVRDIQHV